MEVPGPEVASHARQREGDEAADVEEAKAVVGEDAVLVEPLVVVTQAETHFYWHRQRGDPVAERPAGADAQFEIGAWRPADELSAVCLAALIAAELECEQ